jgi:hypothetical protein
MLEPVAALLREFLHRSGAVRVVAVLEREPGKPPAVVECSRFGPIEIDLGEEAQTLAHDAPLVPPAASVPDVRRLPPFEVDAAEGRIEAPLGGVEHVAGAVQALADALGGDRVAMAQFETTDPATPLSITARAGGAEPIVLALGDEQFEMGS